MAYGRIQISGELLRDVLHLPDDTEMPSHVVLVVWHSAIPGTAGEIVECSPELTRERDGAIRFVGWNPERPT